ncbi:MAG: DUF6776 family protein [Pseudomonadales bacterium]
MTAVKGSKQFQMVVVPYRPWYRAGIFLIFLVALAVFSWMTYEYGMREGLATRVEVIKERDEIKVQLTESLRLIESQRQQIADLKVGTRIDEQATEEVRLSVESLQSEVAELKEEIRFYKGVMLPNVEDQGLRIERLDLRNAGDPNRYRYSLLLTQVVDKHEYIQGDVQVNLVGMSGESESSLPIGQVSDAGNSIRFRFRYFQNIEGELTLPEGFVPREVTVVAQASGRGAKRLERSFRWEAGGG